MQFLKAIWNGTVEFVDDVLYILEWLGRFLRTGIVAIWKGIVAIATWEVTVFGVFAWCYGFYLVGIMVADFWQGMYEPAYASAAAGYFVGVIWYTLYFASDGTHKKIRTLLSDLNDDMLGFAKTVVQENTELKAKLAQYELSAEQAKQPGQAQPDPAA